MPWKNTQRVYAQTEENKTCRCGDEGKEGKSHHHWDGHCDDSGKETIRHIWPRLLNVWNDRLDVWFRLSSVRLSLDNNAQKEQKACSKKKKRYLGGKFIFNGRDALGDALGDLTVAKGDFLVGNYYETLD